MKSVDCKYDNHVMFSLVWLAPPPDHRVFTDETLGYIAATLALNKKSNHSSLPHATMLGTQYRKHMTASLLDSWTNFLRYRLSGMVLPR